MSGEGFHVGEGVRMGCDDIAAYRTVMGDEVLVIEAEGEADGLAVEVVVGIDDVGVGLDEGGGVGALEGEGELVLQRELATPVVGAVVGHVG